MHRNDLDKACFAHDSAYSGSKDLAKRTISDKILKETAYEIARNPNYYKYQRGLASMVYKFFDKKTWLGITVNEQIAEELHKLVTKNSNGEKDTWDFKTIFGQQVKLK